VTRTSTNRSYRLLLPAVLAIGVLLALAPAAPAGSAAAAKRCGSVFFTPQSDDLAAAIRAVGVRCRFARRFVRDSKGRPGQTYRGFACVSRLVEREDSLTYTRYRCTSGSKVVRWKRF
jgi:hypothetical protein